MHDAPPLFLQQRAHNGAELEDFVCVGQVSKTGGMLASLSNLPARVSAPRELLPETAPHESQPGHVYHLAESLNEDRATTDGMKPFGDVARVPVPNEVLDGLADLNGCAVRLCVALMAEAYSWTGSGWKCSARYLTRSEIDGLGMSPQSVRNAAETLLERGWIDRQTRGQSHAYRWRLSCPQKRFTFLPLGLLHDHTKVSDASLTLLLTLYRATWGWTEGRDGATVHRASVGLSMGDLSERTGLCPSTLRSAASEVIHNGAADRTRTGPSDPYSWTVDASFFRYRRTNSEGGTSRERKSIQQTRTGVSGGSAASSGDSVAGEGKAEGEKEKDTALSEREKRDVNRLMSDPFGLPYPIACNLVSRHSTDLLQSSMGMYRQQADDVRNPGGWIRAALENRWAASIPDKTPDERQTDGDGNPFAQAIKNMDSDGSQKSEGGAVVPRQRLGMSHDEMSAAVTAIRGLDASMFVQIEHDDTDRVTFVPNRATANWAWKHSGDLLPEANKHASRLVRTRKQYEQKRGS